MLEPPPHGCCLDAMKLFIGNIPKHYNEELLQPVFAPFGTVIELVVLRETQTTESKGSAFVWYKVRSRGIGTGPCSQQGKPDSSPCCKRSFGTRRQPTRKPFKPQGFNLARNRHCGNKSPQPQNCPPAPHAAQSTI